MQYTKFRNMKCALHTHIFLNFVNKETAMLVTYA